jgi:hypothetical protein
MRKLVLTAIAGSICAVFGSAYADSSVGNNDTIRLAQGAISGPKAVPDNSDKGVKTPRNVPETRPDAMSKPEPAVKPVAPAPAAMSAPPPPMEEDRAPRRRAARKEKG